MPPLNWSPGALAALRNKSQREKMTRLFDAYFRVAGEKDLTGAILPLDLPTESNPKFIAPPHVDIARLSNPARPGAPLRESPQPLIGAPPLVRSEMTRHHFYAKFSSDKGWVVSAKLKLEHRIINKGAALR